MTSVDKLTADLRAFVAERDWQQFHDPKNLAMLLASEVGEVLAELRWVRSEEIEEFVTNPTVRDRLTDEIGDVAIALVLLCDKIGIDPISAAGSKLRKNQETYPVAASRGIATRVK